MLNSLFSRKCWSTGDDVREEASSARIFESQARNAALLTTRYISQLISFPTPAVEILALYVDFNAIDLSAIIEHTAADINHSSDPPPLFTRALERFARNYNSISPNQSPIVANRAAFNSFAYRFGVTVLALISEHNCLDDK